MLLRSLGTEGQNALEKVLGYVNFSSGKTDPQFFISLDFLYARCFEGKSANKQKRGAKQSHPLWQTVGSLLREKLAMLHGQGGAFADCEQASGVLNSVLDHVIPGYRRFHRDLLFHLTDDQIFGPLMFGRICEAVVNQGPPWNDHDRIGTNAISSINDYIGHRPVPALENRRQEPYSHEWTRPIPLYIDGAGVASGPYRQLIEKALMWLNRTDEDLLREAFFDPSKLRELAMDARAYDFEHPVNKRPNYHFGQWDPHQIDNRGFYRRFVVQQVTLDALLTRVSDNRQLPPEELLDEAAAVLGGTMLMASGISGEGPDTHDSTTNLATLLAPIASYRDRYYLRLMNQLPDAHARRLQQEASQLHQPFGGARQHLNRHLARIRAIQLEHVHLARLYARMGYPDAARRQAHAVPVASARMLSRIDCHLTTAKQACDAGELDRACARLEDAKNILHRAIACGAIVDPWNILGFDANFSLFPAMENSVRDHRIDDLVQLIERILNVHANAWCKAAARDQQSTCDRLSAQFEEIAKWWHQFATHEVQSVDAPRAMENFHAAENVTKALNLWHKGGAAAGDVAFWAPHAEMFDTPKSYVLIVETLLDRGDHVTSMALLMHWLSQSDKVPLEQGGASFHRLSQRWMRTLLYGTGSPSPTDRESADTCSGNESGPPCSLVRRFFDYLEANAEHYWKVPVFDLASPSAGNEPNADPLNELADQEDEELYSAAYENVVYRDSTDDGMDAPIFSMDHASEDELEKAAERVVDRLAFLHNLAKLWSTSALFAASPQCRSATSDAEHRKQLTTDLQRWRSQITSNRRGLFKLLDRVHGHPISPPRGDHSSMIEYDRKRLIKETLLDQIVATCAETAEAERFMVVALRVYSLHDDSFWKEAVSSNDDELRLAITIMSDALLGRAEDVRKHCIEYVDVLRSKPILHVPVTRGGVPRKVATVTLRKRTIETMLAWLPRLGLFTETRHLLDVVREMERNVSVGPGAVTQFDELFAKGFASLVKGLVCAAKVSERTDVADPDEAPTLASDVESDLVDCLERLTETLLVGWLDHSRTLRLSVLEKVSNRDRWDRLVDFIKEYGEDIFTQHFLNVANLRGILHEGVDPWLTQIEENVPEAAEWALFKDLGGQLNRQSAVEHLALVLEAIVENYAEYREYNSTTTQSDHGGMLYTLLDFLRLRVSYDRVTWNLKPVMLVHRIMVQHQRSEAAQVWRRALNERITDEANRYLNQLSELQTKYAMRMATVADRIGERFLRSMSIDRMRALVGPAMDSTRPKKAEQAFSILEEEVALLMKDPSGAGLNLPPWFSALEEETTRIQNAAYEGDEGTQLDRILPRISRTLEDFQNELSQW